MNSQNAARERVARDSFAVAGSGSVGVGETMNQNESQRENEQPSFVVSIAPMPGVTVTHQTLWEALGLTESECADMQAEINRQCDEIRECERQAWISAKDVWIR